MAIIVEEEKKQMVGWAAAGWFAGTLTDEQVIDDQVVETLQA